MVFIGGDRVHFLGCFKADLECLSHFFLSGGI